MKNNKVQFILCILISVLCWTSVLGKSEKILTDSICDYQIEVSAGPTTLYMNIYNPADFGPYTPDVVEWYSPDWQLEFGDSATVVYELDVNFPPSFEMLICADYEVGGETCTACEWVFVGDVNPCEYELILETNDLSVFGILFSTVSGFVPDELAWILENDGNVISNDSILLYDFDEPGEYIICVEYSDTALGCGGVLCDTIVVGDSISCETDFEIQYFTDYNWGIFEASYPDIYEVNEASIAWSINGDFIEYGSTMDYIFSVDGNYVVCMIATNVINTITGEVCPTIQVCTKVEIVNYQTDCSNLEIHTYINNDSAIFELSYPYSYELDEDSVVWYINGQLFEYGSTIDYNFPENGNYNFCVVVPKFLNLANNEICPEQELCLMVEFIGQQDNCEAFFEWKDKGNINGMNTVTFTNLSSGNYSNAMWDFGDGHTSNYSGIDSLEHVYENIGVYNVCLTIWDNIACESSYCEVVLVSGTPTDECDYEMEYNLINDTSFIFTINSPFNQSANTSWLNFETGEEYGTGDSIFVAFDDYGVYEICAIVNLEPDAPCGFGDLVLCETITVQNPECEDTDCVFPGDTDRNMVADNYDILPIGLHFGETGPPRPNAAIDWYGQPAPDWQISADSINLKHIDCNGDGEIFFDDVDAIEQNYNRTHDGVYATRVEGAPGLHLEFELDTIYSAPDTGSIIINADIIMGTADLPVDEIYGVAFSIAYPIDLVDSSEVSADYFMESWIGDPTTVLQLEQNVVSESVIDFAYSRTDQQNTSGFGQIGSVSFVMTDNIIGKLATEIELNFPISNVRAIKNTGEEIVITGSENALVVNLENTVTTAENPDLSQSIKIFPNPTLNTINLTISDLQAQAVTLYNTVGQPVLARQIVASNTQLDVRHLPAGVYLLNIQTDKGFYNQKLVISD